MLTGEQLANKHPVTSFSVMLILHSIIYAIYANSMMQASRTLAQSL